MRGGILLLIVAFAAGCTESRSNERPGRVVLNKDAPDESLEEIAAQRKMGFEEKVLLYQSQMQADPKNPQPCFQLGDLYDTHGKFDLAAHYYEKLVSLVEPDRYTGPYYRLGRALALQGKYNEAIPMLKRCVAVKQDKPDVYVMNPDYAEGHYLLGALYNQTGDSKNMIFHYREYLRLGGDQKRIARYLARVVEP